MQLAESFRAESEVQDGHDGSLETRLLFGHSSVT